MIPRDWLGDLFAGMTIKVTAGSSTTFDDSS